MRVVSSEVVVGRLCGDPRAAGEFELGESVGANFAVIVGRLGAEYGRGRRRCGGDDGCSSDAARPLILTAQTERQDVLIAKVRGVPPEAWLFADKGEVETRRIERRCSTALPSLNAPTMYLNAPSAKSPQTTPPALRP